MHRCSKQKIDIFSICEEATVFELLTPLSPNKQSNESNETANPSKNPNKVLGSQSIANALYSLQHRSDYSPATPSIGDPSNIYSSSPETDAAGNNLLTRRLISVLTEQLDLSSESLDGQAVANSLYGMQSLKWDSLESLDLLEAILQAISRNAAKQKSTVDSEQSQSPSFDQPTQSTSISLDKITARAMSKEARLEKLTKELSEVSLPITAQGIGSAFVGIQNLQSGHSEMRVLLKILSNCLSRSLSTPLDSQAIANVVLGLKSCSGQEVP